MIKRILVLLILISSCIVQLPVYASEVEKTPSGIPFANLEEEIDKYVSKYLDQSTPGAAITVVKDGAIIFSKGYGYANLEKEIMVDPHKTVFEYGSISKLFVWTAAMQLVEQGKLDLHADIKTYLPEDVASKLTYQKPITMHHIMNHTAGFEDYYFDLIGSSPESILALEEVLIRHQPKQIYEPGRTIAYSNYATALAGYVIEQITGKSFFDYEMEQIFSPLSMGTTSGHPALTNYLDFENKATGYLPNGHGEFTEGIWSYISLYPAGSVNGTAEDLAKFAIALMPKNDQNTPLFSSKSTLDKMLTQSYSPTDMMLSIAHGFWEYDGKVRGVGHGGNTAAFSTNMVVAPEEQFGVIVLTNAASEMDLTYGVMDLLFGKSDDMIQTATVDLPSAEKVTGLYIAARQSRSMYTEFINYLTPLKVEAISENKLTISLYGMKGTYLQSSPNLYTLISSDYPILGYILSKVYVELNDDGVERLTNGQVTDYLPLEGDRKLPWLIISLVIVGISGLYFVIMPIVWLIILLKNRKKNSHYSTETKLFWMCNLMGTLFILNNSILSIRTIVNSPILHLEELQLHIYFNWILLFITIILISLDFVMWKLVNLNNHQKYKRVFTFCLVALLFFVFFNWNFFHII
ncbi:MAG: serine hydrolase domain-containing protein [Solibacillus sp.]